MKLLENNEFKTVLISAIISTIVCIGFNVGRSEVSQPVSIKTVSQPSVASTALAPATASASISVPQTTVSNVHENVAPKGKNEWQTIANSIAPGFVVSRIDPIQGSNAVNLVDDRDTVTNLDSSIITVANDGSWWEDAQGFHLAIKNGAPLNDPRATIKQELALKRIQEFPKAGIVTYPSTAPAGTKTYDVYEFSSLDCVYCRHVSADIAKYQATGLNIHVIPFPRTGPNSPAWRLAEKIWCATPSKRPEMVEKAFASEQGDDVTPVADKDLPDPNAACVSWVKQGYADAVWLNIPGTPGLFAGNGKLIGGYIPPANLRQVVEQAEGQAGK